MNIYVPIQSKNIVKQFNDYINQDDNIDRRIIDYVAFGFQNTINGQSTSLMSLSEWQHIYQSEMFAKFDPVRNIALKQISIDFFSFNDISSSNSIEAEIMRRRKILSMKNGFVFVERHVGFNYMLTFATNFTKFNSRVYFQHNISAIRKILHDMKIIINQAHN